jgi:hypothetical protein
MDIRCPPNTLWHFFEVVTCVITTKHNMTSVEQVCHGSVCIQGIGFYLPLNFFASATQKVL